MNNPHISIGIAEFSAYKLARSIGGLMQKNAKMTVGYLGDTQNQALRIEKIPALTHGGPCFLRYDCYSLAPNCDDVED